MSKYCYGKMANGGWFVRLANWKLVTNEKGELLPFVRILKKFRTQKECVDYINYLKKGESCDKL